MSPRGVYRARDLVAAIDRAEGTRTVTLDLPEPPSANRWWRKYRNVMVKSEEARAYQEMVQARLLAAGLLRRRGAAIVAGAVFPKPELVRVAVQWHRRRKSGDLDKRLGVLLDALQGTVYDSDAQIAKLEAERFDEGTGRVRVEITPHGRAA